MTTRPQGQDLENELVEMLLGNKLISGGVVDIGLPSRFVSKCIREGFERARVMYEVLGTLEPENISTPKLEEIQVKLKKRIAQYLCDEFSRDNCSPETTPYPEMANDVVGIVFGYE